MLVLAALVEGKVELLKYKEKWPEQPKVELAEERATLGPAD